MKNYKKKTEKIKIYFSYKKKENSKQTKIIKIRQN